MSRGGAGAGEVRILAPAKVNLGLAVLGKRPDGYHELRTIFQAVSLCDRVVLRRTRRGVAVRCPALPSLGETNLAHRAAALFLRETGRPGGMAIDLDKRIPAGGGLGGGSSDAAAVLLGSCRLHGIAPPAERLREWAAELGSDVPFFIEGGAALGEGRGERLSALPPGPAGAAVLIHAPDRGLSTAAVYGRLDAAALTARGSAFTILLRQWREGSLERFGQGLFNDLEPPAYALSPGLASVKEALLGAGAAGALLSGSGSCTFGLFPGPAEARRAASLLRGRVQGRLFGARFLPPRRRWGVAKR